jgi:hypothetical protein
MQKGLVNSGGKGGLYSQGQINESVARGTH